MDIRKIDNLIVKFLEDDISIEESNELVKWLDSSKDNQDYFNEFVDFNQLVNNARFKKQDLRKIKVLPKYPKTRRNRITQYVASALLFLLASSYFLITNNDNSSKKTPTKAIRNHIKPGTDKAFLTLANGSDVILQKGSNYTNNQIKSNGTNIVYDNNLITSKKEVAYNYLTIPKGGQFFIKLSDGTKVWLNSYSKLKYPVSFVKGETREVELLYGEAYFDVSHSKVNNEIAAFKVLTKTQNIKVLGTEFNIKSYDKTITTTLVKGAVKVSNESTSKFLSPGMQSIAYVNSKDIVLKKADINYEIAWRKGLFIFNKEPLIKIAKVLERWYDVTITFENKEKEKNSFTGKLSRNKNINELLKIIEKTNEVKFQITDKNIIVK